MHHLDRGPVHRMHVPPGPGTSVLVRPVRLVSRGRRRRDVAAKQLRPGGLREPERPAAIARARPRRHVAAGSADRAYSRPARRGTARTAACAPGRDDRLVEPVGVDGVVRRGPSGRVPAAGPERRARGVRGRVLERPPGPAGTSPSASRTAPRTRPGSASGRRARRGGPSRRGSRRPGPRARRRSRSAVAPTPVARRRPGWSRSAADLGDRPRTATAAARASQDRPRSAYQAAIEAGARPSGTRRGPGRTGGASTCARGHRARPRRTAPGTARLEGARRRLQS